MIQDNIEVKRMTGAQPENVIKEWING
jgi:hypothetical protein